MRRTLLALVVLAGLLMVIDRGAAAVADRAVARQIRTELSPGAEPSVHINGFPFLTQAARGRYQDVRVAIPDVDSGRLKNIDVAGRLQGVRAPLDDMIGGRLDQVPVREISGTLSVSYDDLARASDVPGLRVMPSGSSGVTVSGQVEVLGQRVDAAATARITVDGADLVITATDAKIEGVQLPAAALQAAAQLLSFRVTPSELPLDLRITAVRTEPTAVKVTAQAQDVVLRRGALTAGRTLGG